MPGEGKAKRRAVVFPVSQQFLSESLVSQSLFECESSAIIKVTVQLAAGNPEEEEEMCAVKQGGACVCACVCVCTHARVQWAGLSSLIKEIPKEALLSEAGGGRDETRRGHSEWMRARTSSRQGASLPPAPSLQRLDFGPLSSPLCLLTFCSLLESRAVMESWL